MTTKCFEFCMGVVCFLAVTKATPDCTRNPPWTREMKHCCKHPEPNWNAFQRECSYDTKIQNPPSPCTIECIFNVSESLQNDVLNKPKARIMLSKLFDDKDFVDAHMAAFERCQPLMTRKIKENSELAKPAKRSGANMGRAICSPLYMYYAVCLHKFIFVNCPAHAWTASKVCEEAKEYATICNQSEMSVKRGYGKHFRKGNKAHNDGGFLVQY